VTIETDATPAEQKRLVEHGFRLVIVNMGRSIWKHPDHPARTFYVAEAIEQIERDEKRQAAA
jgi:hypothetical protein